MYKERIDAYFSNREDELVEAVSRLVAIPSTAGPAEPGKPFGAGPAAALAAAVELARRWGLEAADIEGYVAAADLNGRDTALHILGHLDVVDGGEGWMVTDPFVPRVVDGMLYGRGVSDDKGPVVAALMAMRAVKELGIPLKHNARLIMGADEESGSSDIAYYYQRHPYAPYVFSPDADFPLIHVEKGLYRPAFEKRWPPGAALPRVSALSGGVRVNVVPHQAEAVVEGLSAVLVSELAAQAARETGARFQVRAEGQAARILCTGTGGHAAEPQKANNAITALLTLLAALPLASGGSTEAVRALHRLFPHGDLGGRALGVAQSDEISGPLTLALTLLTLDETGARGRFDSRTPLCANRENCRRQAETALAAHGFAVTGHEEMDPPHHTPADSTLVETLLDCYEAYTGQKGQCKAIGGSTYVHGIPGGVAFGCTMPGFVSNLHGPDERMPVQDLMLSAKMFAEAIIRLCS